MRKQKKQRERFAPTSPILERNGFSYERWHRLVVGGPDRGGYIPTLRPDLLPDAAFLADAFNRLMKRRGVSERAWMGVDASPRELLKAQR